MKKQHPSILKLWNSFIEENENHKRRNLPPSWCFCDNEKDADECANLVVRKIKQATCSSLIAYEKDKEPLPKVGDIDVVTNWKGEAQAIIETTAVKLIPYNQIDAAFAKMEGEGDKSLKYWKKVHWDFFSRELKTYNLTPNEEMMLIAQKFKTIYP